MIIIIIIIIFEKLFLNAAQEVSSWPLEKALEAKEDILE